MLIAFCDTETTGLDPEKGHKIVEIAIVVCDSDSRLVVDTFVQRINPGRSIDPDAQAVHGISFDDVSASPTWEEVEPRVSEMLGRCHLFVAHNAEFDGGFIAAEMLNLGISIPKIDHFCTTDNGRWACADGKRPKLAELSFALGVSYDPAKAHGALYDIEVTKDCFFKGMDRGFFNPPTLLRE